MARATPDYPADSSSRATYSVEGNNEEEIRERPDTVSNDAQIGVQGAEATALVWSTKALYAIYACNMIYYASAGFSSAPQISQAFILSTIIGGGLQLLIAKVLNLWGRAECFLTFLGVLILGIIVIISCYGPNGFAAGYTLYWIGYNNFNFILSVFVTDTSGLRNRAFVYAFADGFVGTPTICTHKAETMGVFIRGHSNCTPPQSLILYFHEFDLVGIFLLMAVFVLLLLPFSLTTYGYGGYSSVTFIGMIIPGILLFPIFTIWERSFAPTPFIKWPVFKSRTVLGTFYNLNTAKTGYMTQIYSVGSTIWIFIAFGGRTLVIADEMAVMAAADRDSIPMMIAMISLFGSVGGAIGNAVAVAIYSDTFPQALLRALPSETREEYSRLYLRDATAQLVYPPGTETRKAINHAWGQSQKYECITAAAVVVLAFPAIAVWKDHSVDRKQVKGTVI
ncbi:hypothetical protein ASPCADRAFT_504318 [Aspergillus carbonarius ITEM 5010]|uniref:Major facilitator superfamily (MFS) profile domain-containing protein n=1 Tax=Aspergillus carbonarius (strain ITEM 5010) TaxID=602072 RepID=A0A1R3RW62_ASPC5|nr:hypothetical protein ASPCADRAFT_504318 [Aspergillus carbonarius ITEM 5010]